MSVQHFGTPMTAVPISRTELAAGAFFKWIVTLRRFGDVWRSSSIPCRNPNALHKTIDSLYIMLQLKPLDEAFPIFRQINESLSPVVLVIIFNVAEADVPALLAAWEVDANWMKKQTGYISTQLHRGIAGSTVVMNYAIWESVAPFRAAFNHLDFQSALSQYPDSAVASPHLFTRCTVPNLCVGP